MSLALTDDQRLLADAAARIAADLNANGAVRRDPDGHRAGRTDGWDAIVRQGLHAVHLPESLGGQGGAVTDLAVVVEEFGRGLVPGPFLATVSASATVAGVSGPAADAAVRRFADGARGAVVGPDGLTATRTPTGWMLTGTSDPAPGVASAEVLVVGARSPGDGDDDDGDGDGRWFVVGADRAHRRPGSGVDLTRDVGTATFDAVAVGPGERLDGLTTERVRLVATALLAAEAAGLFRWFVDSAVAYVKVREQFGRPVGTFQAVQHRAARLLVAAELAAAAAWDGVRSLSAPTAQSRLGVGAAAVVALGRVVDAALEALGLFGGIGSTWEHDLQLYWRRAMSVAALAGTTASWLTLLGEAALDERRDFAVEVTGDAGFRGRIAAVLDEAATLPDTVPDGVPAGVPSARRAFLAERGLVAAHLPQPYGLGATPEEQLVIAEEFGRRGLTRPPLGMGTWVLPTVIALGTEEQRERLARRTLRGEIVWCQLFSEPGAGSDVASVTTRGVRVDGGWRVTGQKVWTSLAHVSHWGAALVRTDPDQPKHRGLTLLLVDMHAAGVLVRPLQQASGDALFSEVFLNDVFVPDDDVVGQPGHGWQVALTTMASERQAIAGAHDSADETRIRALLESGAHAGSRADVLHALALVTAENSAVAALNMQITLRRLGGADAGPAGSVAKYASAQVRRNAATAAFGLLGPAGAAAGGDSVHAVLDIPTWILGGGTAEIQLNIIAQFALGLPRQAGG